MKYILKTAITLIVTALLTACANTPSQAIHHGSTQYHQQNYNNAFQSFLSAAKRGISSAQYAVGYMYYYGQGTQQNLSKALYWITRAAKNGNPNAAEAIKQFEQQQGKPPALRNPSK